MRRWPRSALANLHARPLSRSSVENDQKRQLSLWSPSHSSVMRVFLAAFVRKSKVDRALLTSQHPHFMPTYANSQGSLLVSQARPYSSSRSQLAKDSILTRVRRGRERGRGGYKDKPSLSSDGGTTLLEALRAEIEAKRVRGVDEERASLGCSKMSANERNPENRVVTSVETPNLLPEIAKKRDEEDQHLQKGEHSILTPIRPPHLRPLDRHYSDDEIEKRVSGWIKAFAPVYAEQTEWGTARRWQTVRRGYKFRKGPITLTSSGLPKRDRRPAVIAERRREELEGLSEELVEARCRFRWAILSVEQRRKWHDVLTREEKILFLEWAALEPCDVDGEARMAAFKRRQKEGKEAGTQDEEDDSEDDDSSW